MMFIRNRQKAGIYLLSLAVHIVNAWGESNTLLLSVFTPTLYCFHSNTLLPSVFTPTLCCLVHLLQYWSNFKRDCTFFHATSVISILCIYMITIHSSYCLTSYSVMRFTYLTAYRSTW